MKQKAVFEELKKKPDKPFTRLIMEKGIGLKSI